MFKRTMEIASGTILNDINEGNYDRAISNLEAMRKAVERKRGEQHGLSDKQFKFETHPIGGKPYSIYYDDYAGEDVAFYRGKEIGRSGNLPRCVEICIEHDSI